MRLLTTKYVLKEKSILFTCLPLTAIIVMALYFVPLESKAIQGWLWIASLIICATQVLLTQVVYLRGRQSSKEHKLLETYKQAVASCPYAIAVYDKNDILIDYNDSYVQLHKASFEKKTKIISYYDLMKAAAPDFATNEEKEQWIADKIATQRSGDGAHIDRLYPDGRWLRVSKHKMPNQGVVGYGIDITDLKTRELQLQDAESRYFALAQIAPVGIWQISSEGKTLFGNDALSDIFETSSVNDLTYSNLFSRLRLFQDQTLMPTEETLKNLLNGEDADYLDAELSLGSPDKPHQKSLYIARSRRLQSNDGDYSHMFVVIDVTKQKRAEREIRFLAEHDSLTSLANRTALNNKLNHLLKEAQPFALVLIDLDHFKDINDTLGHHSGDRLLKEAALRLQHSLRNSDFASRLGGDEFAVILPKMSNLTDAKSMLIRLYDCFKKPIEVNGNTLQINASSGIAIYPDHGDSAEQLIQHADIALYRQKSLGRGSFTLFESKLADEIQQRKQLEQDLRRALDSCHELSVNYQPQYHIDSLAINGVEALVRWKNARTDEWISPADFIPLAEQTGLIFQLDRFVLETAARQVNAWHQLGHNQLVLASNLSAVHFRGDALPEMIHDVLTKTGLSPENLELEITEGLFLEEQSKATSQLQKFRKKGIRIAVDDFGTGYSNLGYLNNLPVDSLKIDRSFIDNFDKNDYYRAIVRFIIELGHNLKLDIIAEGIETEEQLTALQTLRCSHGQGYFLTRPQPANAIEEILSQKPAAQIIDKTNACSADTPPLKH